MVQPTYPRDFPISFHTNNVMLNKISYLFVEMFVLWVNLVWIRGFNLSGLFFILLYHIFFGFLLVVFLFLAADSLLVLWYAEVITSAEFHPTHCNTLAYSSSKGSIRLVDLRQSALCDTHSQMWAFIWYFLLPISIYHIWRTSDGYLCVSFVLGISF